MKSAHKVRREIDSNENGTWPRLNACRYADQVWTILTFILCTWVYPAVAAPICPPQKSVISDARALSKYTLHVNQVGDADRKIAGDFARGEPGQTRSTIEARYSATGDFSCGIEHFGQGQLTIKNNIITTSAHTFFGGTECPLKPAPISKCKFTAMVRGKPQDYAIEQLVATGFKCTSDGQKLKPSQDWVIFKLKASVDNSVRPYAVIKDPSKIFEQKPIVVVSKSHDFNPTKKEFLRDAERHYSRCEIQYVYGNSSKPLAVESDCDTSGNSSGGSVLTPGPNPILLGVHSGAAESCGTPGRTGPYQRGCWAAVMTPIAGDFLTALTQVEPIADDRPVKPQDFPAQNFKDL